MRAQELAFSGFALVVAEQVFRLQDRGEVEPAGEGAAGGEGFRLAGEGDEGELGGFGGQGVVAAGPLGGHVDESGVACDQGVECRLAMALEPVGEEFGIGWTGRRHVLGSTVRVAGKADKKM